VNIIGEHIDYNLYDVLPTAVSVDVIVAVKVLPSLGSEATVKIANVNPEKFPSREFAVPFDKDVEIDPTKHEWVNYFKAGLVGALKFLRKESGTSAFKPASLEVLLDGNVPPGGGISSSAAFVCASALAVMKANNHNVSKQDLLDLAVVSERAVGVYSGGLVPVFLLQANLFC
jgi:galactokinase